MGEKREYINTLTITKAKLSECLREANIINFNEEIDYVAYSPSQDRLHLAIVKVFENISDKLEGA